MAARGVRDWPATLVEVALGAVLLVFFFWPLLTGQMQGGVQ